MGVLVEGEWVERWYDTSKTEGHFERPDARIRDWIEEGEPGRYHLFVAMACPWAHRTLIYRSLLGLEDAIGVTIAKPEMLEHGWVLSDEPHPVPDARYLYEIYQATDSEYSGRVTVPVLWDTRESTIVNNESSEIIRMLDERFGVADPDLRPESRREEIDALNARIYRDINNGVYKTGFATTQAAYELAASALFDALDWLEEHLEGKTFLVGERLTEADIRLFTTLIRFDPVYHVHFKCTKRRLRDYPRLWELTRRVYHTPGVAETVDMSAIRRHYFYSHESINPHRIVPLAPEIDYSL